MNIKIVFKIFSLLILFCFLECIYGCNPNSSYSDSLKWMKENSTVKIPEEATVLKIINNHEWGIIAKLSLDSINVNKFITENKLLPWKPFEEQLVMIEDIETDWYDSDYKIKKKGLYFFNKDCKPGYFWCVLVNNDTNELWFQILYADFGGDIPDCNPKHENL